MRQYITILFFLVISQHGYASDLYKSCNLLTVHTQKIKLYEEKSQIILIHNISDVDLWLVTSDGNINSQLKTNKWSALLLNNTKLMLTCIESKPGHEQQVPCADLIAMCQIKNKIKATLTNSPTIWLGENMKRKYLLETISAI